METSRTVSQVSESLGIALVDVAEAVGCALPASADPGIRLRGGASLETAKPWHVAYMDHARYAEALRATLAGACVVAERFVHMVPSGTVALISRDPHRAYAAMLARMYPDTLRPSPVFSRDGAMAAGCFVHPSAQIGAGVILDPGAVIGEQIIVGAGTTLGAHVTLGPDVSIGSDCSIGPNVTLARCTIGDRAILHPGVRVGQDGFGFALGASGHLKVPQLGRVVIGNDVEIGANTTIDRGSSRDTVIGDGTKIDNLVQIAHNVRIGRHCVIVAQAGIAGSTVLEDNVAIGGQSAIAGHLHIGQGAQLAAASRLMRSVPAGEQWGGMPAKNLRQWFREQATLSMLVKHRLMLLARSTKR